MSCGAAVRAWRGRRGRAGSRRRAAGGGAARLGSSESARPPVCRPPPPRSRRVRVRGRARVCRWLPRACRWLRKAQGSLIPSPPSPGAAPIGGSSKAPGLTPPHKEGLPPPSPPRPYAHPEQRERGDPGSLYRSNGVKDPRAASQDPGWLYSAVLRSRVQDPGWLYSAVLRSRVQDPGSLYSAPSGGLDPRALTRASHSLIPSPPPPPGTPARAGHSPAQGSTRTASATQAGLRPT